MNTSEVIARALALVERSRSVLVGSVDGDGYPNIKGMFNLKHDGLRTFLFSTNTSSKRVSQFVENPQACLYFVDLERIEGLQLTGKMEALQDPELKQLLWFDGCEKYYPLGVTDPDYTVLRFTAERGNYYHRLVKVDFDCDTTEGPLQP